MTLPHGTARERTGSVSAVTLSLEVLFGQDFTLGLDAELLDSFAANGADWGNAVKAIWALSRGTGATSGPVAVPAPVTAPAPAAQAPAAAAAAVPAAAPAPAPAEAGRLEVFDPSVQDTAPQDSAAAPAGGWAYTEVRDTLVTLLEEATGYPGEVLEEDADLEADLAIDSIKQVEALGALRERYGLTLEDDFSIRDFRTIRKASEYMTSRLNTERAAAVVS